MKALRSVFLLFLLALLACGCASKAKKQAQIRRAYAAGEQAARAQMQQAQAQQQTPPPMEQNGDPQIRIMGSVRNPVLDWTDGLTLARALVEAQYQKQTTPIAITIYRNSQPLHVDPQRLLNGEDYPLFPGDTVFIQD